MCHRTQKRLNTDAKLIIISYNCNNISGYFCDNYMYD